MGEHLEKQQILEKPLEKKECKKIEETIENYLRRKFPKEEEEFDVKYCSVGGNNFRINFYKKKDLNALFSDICISRSYYVVLTKNDNTWEFQVIT